MKGKNMKGGDGYASPHGGGTAKKSVKTDRGSFRMEEGYALDNQAMPHGSPSKGFKSDGPSGSAGGYRSK